MFAYSLLGTVHGGVQLAPMKTHLLLYISHKYPQLFSGMDELVLELDMITILA